MAAAQLTAVGLKAQILTHEDSKYENHIAAFFDASTKLHPSAILQPRSAVEIAEAVKHLASINENFAVCSSGCGNRAGSNNIDGGVMVDLSLLNGVKYDPETELASLEPGANWGHVYDELSTHQRVVPGGRVENVGVGGLLLGGGLSFYAGQTGFACDNVVAYEVVLADGSIITANSVEHEDLFRVLKGGSNNFGIVTRFDMKTQPISPCWGGVALRPTACLTEASKALESFTANVKEDPDSTMIFVAGHQPKFGGDVVMTLCFNVAGAEKPKAFHDFYMLPEVFSDYKSGKISDLLPYSALPSGYYNIWYTLTFKNNASIIQKASDLHYKLSRELVEKVADGDFTSHCAFQPIPLLYMQNSVAAGGNIMGLDAYPHDAIMLQASASVKTVELAEWVHPKVRSIVEDVAAYASTFQDGIVPWLHLNYAAADQNPLQSYGAENIIKMTAASKKI